MTLRGFPMRWTLNIPLLEQLKSEPHRWFRVSELAQAMGVTQRTVLADAEALAEFGFGIEASPHLGLRYLHPAERLCPDQIEWNLNTQVIGRQLSVWNRVGSTNDIAARAAVSPLNEGLVVLAEEQTAGRGRRGRRWLAPPGSSILMSVLLFPPKELRNPALMTSLAAVSVAELADEVCASGLGFRVPGIEPLLALRAGRSDIEPLLALRASELSAVTGGGSTANSESRIPNSESGPVARIKWPNDVRIAGRKVAGILVEQSAAGYVVGIGINVSVAPEQFPAELRQTAASLADFASRERISEGHAGPRLDRSELVRRLLQLLDDLYAQLHDKGPQSFWPLWEQRVDLLGTGVRVQLADAHHLDGILRAAHPVTGLVLELPNGPHITLEPQKVLEIREMRLEPASESQLHL